uniref:Cytochrome c oxidase subunit 3 n=1 Tax=Limnoria quadripunctata TaxID=161573 RepID=A0A023IX83_LIMQU|nr:cytochrome c oxidase subunit III [Limnoria quadripunctata]
MTKSQTHPFHLVSESPWPLTSAGGIFLLMSSMIFWFQFHLFFLVWVSGMSIFLSIFQWWRDVVRESTFSGNHTAEVLSGLELGMLFFILSEVLFFFSFFWAFFHSSLSPGPELGSWPPVGIRSFDPFQIPLLNTMILLTSGVTVTLSHHSLDEGTHFWAVFSLIFTIVLGVYFTILQAYEYNEASFSVADSVYGSLFFVATGFHGFHVVVGTIFLFVCLLRMIKGHFSSNRYFGFEASAWYWHFVDVVWLFLFCSIYWWGGGEYSCGL